MSNSATTSLSVATEPGSIPTFSASAVVLVRLPLWPSAKPARPTGRYTGWAPAQSEEPCVEYRVWPMARCPSSPDSVRSSNTVATRPMSLTTVTVSPSLTAMPADSCPRCCRANRPSKVRLATLIPGA